MKRKFNAVAAQLLCAAGLGCASTPPDFPTSDRPPPKAIGPLTTHLTTRRMQGPTETVAEDLTKQLFVALATHNKRGALAALSSDARIRKGVSGPDHPLEMLVSQTNAPTGSGAVTSSNRSAGFGPAKIVSVETNASRTESLVSVDVRNPPDIAGLWRVRVKSSRNRIEITEVQIPSPR